jgi:hypothetical protein
MEPEAGSRSEARAAPAARPLLGAPLNKTGDRAAAAEVIGVAKTRLLARAAKIDDLGLRKSFLERMSENARTPRLAASLGK